LEEKSDMHLGVSFVSQYSASSFGVSYCVAVYFYWFEQARRVGGQARNAMQEISLIASTQPTVLELHTAQYCVPTVLDKLDM
jgi:hypothetical protein